MSESAKCLLLACALFLCPALAHAADKPNILVFLCDDTGYAEFGFQGGKDIPTPHIDSIAANGVRFTQGYVSGPYCSPTRAGLLTGRYQTRFGHEFNSVARQTGLRLDETTMAERLHELGYATCAIGKWHLGEKPRFRPTRQGFDEFYGTLSNTAFFHPRLFIDSRVSDEVQTIDDPDFYTTAAYAERAVDWLGKQEGKSWFLYVPFNAQHAPLQAPGTYLARFDDIKDEKRHTFTAMMSAMDDAVGKILDKIRNMGQEENTLIFFLSDNGGPTRQTTSRNNPLRGFKASTWEGGIRVPFSAQWKGKLPAGKTYDHPIIQLDILPTALAAAGAPANAEAKLDGVDLLPYLTGENESRPHETLYWRFGNQWAIRHGDWKLVVAGRSDPAGELFNLADDISESKNLAADMPEKVAELKTLYEKWNAEQAPPSAPKERPNRPRRANRRQNAPASARVE
ncbi:MAG TPA: sulfatase-like hydrolase/transferase [Lacipirellulaceae bacterium]|nr:sulfatase-like hydrolase/transferase [Lacipirellulaceae bacterium]